MYLIAPMIERDHPSCSLPAYTTAVKIYFQGLGFIYWLGAPHGLTWQFNLDVHVGDGFVCQVSNSPVFVTGRLGPGHL
jgi:hypothetical protein